jgi:hypothetical protein
VQINRHHIQSPTEIITLHLGIPPEYKQQCIDEIYNLGDSQSQQTNVKAIMTSYQIWNESKVFDRLLDNIQRIIDNLIKKDKRLEFKLTDSWGAVYKKNDYTIPHQHLPNNISFVYYLQSTGNTPLIFDECNFKLNPTDDMLIIFPSYLWHSVSKHNEEKDRICIAGNLQFHF